jgi:N-methylhydantoinase A
LLNAYLAPVLSAYCNDMAKGLDAAHVSTRQRFLMQSNGGVMPLVADPQVHTVRTLLSGPAAGVRGASYLLGRAQGWRDLVTMDIGGTSCDIAFIEEGEPVEQAESMIDGRIAAVPAFDIATVAAGGGSIAWIGASGLIEVGPRSAGASPGPVCYGKGGREPTVTDANLLRGALNADYFLGGKMKLDLAAARAVLDEKIAVPMKIDVELAACGIVRIVNARMVDAIRVEAAKKGIDLAGHTLVPFGGAGPVHAAQVAEQLNMRRVLVPRNPGAFSALGLLCSDVRHDYMRSGMADIATLDAETAEGIFAELERQAAAEVASEGLNASQVVFERQFDMRYAGQGYELRISLSGISDMQQSGALAMIANRFHDVHAEVHGHAARDNAVEIVSYRLRAIVPMPKFAPQKKAEIVSAKPQPVGQRSVLLDARRKVTATVWRRDDLPSGFAGDGPAIIDQLDATTLVPDGWRFSCDAFDNLVLERTGA